ncbi:DivIVA domain-containing protein [Geodermatophilus sp. YIM 151500]|uniref:DivIVA domain-containing protein n=1 Tax=Geodermatophilus sp. YIM 151500 TaxID=2984531 RepID=UPI0021E44BDC|nr:DivIVA domain-containing protein [Geodermatophilus sp. YIM 151500]MCV2491777.1 DivIVA domain-containing protein [Geodermatophilus sp. YIM 151500]
MTAEVQAYETGDRRLTPADVHSVRFTRGTMLRPGYNEVEVDRFLSRVGHELARHAQEKAELRDRVQTLQKQLGEVTVIEPPSDQAVRILAQAQLTADNYVAEAEDFSRQITSDARAQYEEQLRQARESAGAIIQAAHETAAKMTRGGTPIGDADGATLEQLQEQVAYLKAFGQAVRVQLRSYLEALITDVESEWGRADPGALPARPLPAATRSGAQAGPLNVAAELQRGDDRKPGPSANGVEIQGTRG